MILSFDYPFILQEAVFLERKNRFIARVDLNNKEIEVHLANTGRMGELLVYGRKCWLKPAAPNSKRKTQWTLWLIEYQDQLVCLEASYANVILHKALQNGLLPGFEQAQDVKCEVKSDDVRFDFSFRLKHTLYMAEVKSVNYVTKMRGCFPDAPTQRGAHHVQRLLKRWESGEGAALFFLTMGQETREVCLQAIRDPEFTHLVHKAWIKGLPIFAYEARFTPKSITLEKEIVFGG